MKSCVQPKLNFANRVFDEIPEKTNDILNTIQNLEQRAIHCLDNVSNPIAYAKALYCISRVSKTSCI